MDTNIKIYQLSNNAAGPTFSIKRMEAIYDAMQGQSDEPHRHNYYTIVWARQATGRHVVDFKDYLFQGKELFFVRPGQVHQVITDSRPIGWAITFSRDFLIKHHIDEVFLQNINLFRLFGEQPPLVVEEDDKLLEIAEELEGLYTSSITFKYEAIAALLKLFLIYCNHACEQPAKDLASNHSGTCLLRDFKQLVDREYRRQHKVGDYAANLHISPKYLNEVVKSLVGKTAKEMIQDRIIVEAKRLLLFTTKPSKEIAYQLGFEEPLHFSAFFKKCVGVSPSHFRQQ